MKKKRAWLNRTVLSVGLVSFFTDVATDMAVPLLPAFLAGLGAGAAMLGSVEGAADAVASLLKLYAGRKSDATGRRRPWVLGGYFLSSVTRPFLALAAAPWQVLALRVTDRTGKGLRSSPRDAMIAASVPEKNRGMAFSFHQAMDDSGAILATLLSVSLLLVFHNNLRLIFALAAVPGLFAVLTVWLGVRESGSPKKAPKAEAWKAPSSGLWPVLLPLGLFTLGNASDLFLLKKAAGENMPLYSMPLLWGALHVIKVSSAFPGGWLSDRLGPRWTISLAWLVYAAIYAGFAFAQGPVPVIALFIAYGTYFGLSEGAEKAWIASLVPAARRGTAFGYYYVTVGLLALPASLIFGWLWDLAGPKAAFLAGAGMALLAWAVLQVYNGLRFFSGDL